MTTYPAMTIDNVLDLTFPQFWMLADKAALMAKERKRQSKGGPPPGYSQVM